MPEHVREVVIRVGERRTRLQTGRIGGRGPVRLRTLSTGVDGTDEALVASGSFKPPARSRHLVLGHEALAMVVDDPTGTLRPRQLVVPLVRHGCNRCPACKADQADLCMRDDYREHGLKSLHGFMRDEWFADPEQLVPAPKRLAGTAVLAEPLSISVKAFRHAKTIQERLPWLHDRSPFRDVNALVTGTGSLGSLATLLLRLNGIRTWALDRAADDTAPATFVRSLKAEHVNATEDDLADVTKQHGRFGLILETTGVPDVVSSVLPHLDANGILAELGIPEGNEKGGPPWAPHLERLVLQNQVVFGSVNSHRTDFEEALRILDRAATRWGGFEKRLITHRFAPEQHAEAFHASGDDVLKKTIEWG